MATIAWGFEDAEVEKVGEIIAKFSENPFVEQRIRRNIQPSSIEITRERFWKGHLTAQLTSQQRSGPDSAVSTFLREKIGSLGLERCQEADDVQAFVSRTLKENGGIRFHNKIGEACNRNFELLFDKGGWNELQSKLATLQEYRAREPRESDRQEERCVARFIYEEVGSEGLHRIGPKQSRNLLQVIGLTRYETPLDSRISKWLNENLNLPYQITGGGLSQPSYYDFHMDLVQELCSEVDVLPCEFDAAVFTSYSPEWPEDTVEETIL